MNIVPSKIAIDLVAQAIAFGENRKDIEEGKISPVVSKSEAIRLVGRSYLNAWEKEGLIRGFRQTNKDNSKVKYNLLELQKLQLANTLNYFIES